MMARRYAEGTEVSVARSIDEIRRTVLQFGAEQFATFESGNAMAIAFTCHNLSIRMAVELPDRTADQFCYTPSRNWSRSEGDAFRLWEKECRRRLRSLAAVIKAKLIAVADGVSEFETEFMAYVVVATNKTIGEHLRPQLQAAMAGKSLPRRIALPEPEPQSVEILDCETQP